MAQLNQRCDICNVSAFAPNHEAENSLHTPANIETSWPDAIYAQFRRVGIRQVGYVPDAGHSRLISFAKPIRTLPTWC